MSEQEGSRTPVCPVYPSCGQGFPCHHSTAAHHLEERVGPLRQGARKKESSFCSVL